ncbi:phenolic acid decarboxylase [Nocardia sp. NPDC052566]|uniref:phenolic acid decarboxylase n=1 Tax=Nocardia sp. NPDC052566 TaxID=3364330 RepID=UPI0037C52146
MLTSILGARFRWHEANGWTFEPVIVGADTIEYTLTAGPHTGRHAIQHFFYNRVAPDIETTAWYEESGALVHITWYLDSQTSHRFWAAPAWLAKDFSVYIGDNQDPAFLDKMAKLRTEQQDWPRHVGDDDGYFELL